MKGAARKGEGQGRHRQSLTTVQLRVARDPCCPIPKHGPGRHSGEHCGRWNKQARKRSSPSLYSQPHSFALVNYIFHQEIQAGTGRRCAPILMCSLESLGCCQNLPPTEAFCFPEIKGRGPGRDICIREVNAWL
ncbi:unnamed protein product [Caretta caretta]